ncbi:MAG TPA: hypothetical protein VK204_16220 [Nocardioidaceae bacterium]|nr:hypothetical protein [Nocardioidaceae bacterium]
MSGDTRALHHSKPKTPAQRHLRLAWVFVALTVPAFLAAMVIGEGLLTQAGYTSEDTVPFDVVVRSAGPALLVMLAPPAGAIWYGLRARREGSPNGFIPAVVGTVIAAAVIVTNVGSYVLSRIMG